MRTLRVRLFLLALVVGCGTRTGLLLDDDLANTAPDGGTKLPKPLPDADLPDGDVDALPAIDARPPPDAPVRNPCPDAGATLVYVVTEENDLYSFYPPDLSFTRIGRLACPDTSPSATPFSMTVDRKGTAYVVFTDGALFRVSTATAACVATSYRPGQDGFVTFGMGYVANVSDPGETLFVAEGDLQRRAPSRGLASIDTSTFALRFVGPFAPSIPPPELTGTGDGRLFAWAPIGNAASGSHLYEVDKTTGAIVGQNALAIGRPNDAFAFAYWGGKFWIFTSPQGTSTVTRYDLATREEVNVTTLPRTIVGAGVSTCAPQ